MQEHISLMNYWYIEPHWDYDRNKLRFIEISDSKEHDGDGIEEPRPGTVVYVARDGQFIGSILILAILPVPECTISFLPLRSLRSSGGTAEPVRR